MSKNIYCPVSFLALFMVHANLAYAFNNNCTYQTHQGQASAGNGVCITSCAPVMNGKHKTCECKASGSWSCSYGSSCVDSATGSSIQVTEGYSCAGNFAAPSKPVDRLNRR